MSLNPVLQNQTHVLHSFPAHFHPYLTIVRMVQGERKGHSGGAEWIARAGDLLIFDPYEIHACSPETETPLAFHSLRIDPALARQAGWVMGSLCPVRNPALTEAFDRLSDQLSVQPDPDDSLPLLQDFFSRLNRFGQKTAWPGCEILQKLDKAFEPEWTIADLEEQFLCSRASLYRFCRQNLGCSPGGLLESLRIAYAERQLPQGRPLCQIAAQSGFCDQSEMSRNFARMHGLPPGRLRNLLRDQNETHVF